MNLLYIYTYIPSLYLVLFFSLSYTHECMNVRRKFKCDVNTDVSYTHVHICIDYTYVYVYVCAYTHPHIYILSLSLSPTLVHTHECMQVRRKFKCDVCEKKAAVMECVTCVVKYCEACLETCHPKERAVFKVSLSTFVWCPF